MALGSSVAVHSIAAIEVVGSPLCLFVASETARDLSADSVVSGELGDAWHHVGCRSRRHVRASARDRTSSRDSRQPSRMGR